MYLIIKIFLNCANNTNLFTINEEERLAAENLITNLIGLNVSNLMAQNSFKNMVRQKTIKKHIKSEIKTFALK